MEYKNNRQHRPVHEHAPGRSWNPAHFPQGTMVRVMEDSTMRNVADKRNGGSLLFQVHSIYPIRGRSWTIETTTHDDQKLFGEGSKVSFNLSWVEAIVVRGGGPVVFAPSYAELNPEPRDTYSPYHEDEAHLIAKAHARTGRSYKNHYVFYTFDRLKFLNIIESVVGKVAHLDMSKMVWTIKRLRPEWIRLEGQLMEHFIVPKRDLKRWIRQNVRRYLTPLDAIEAFERQLDKEEHDREMRDYSDSIDMDDMEDTDADSAKDETFALRA